MAKNLKINGVKGEICFLTDREGAEEKQRDLLEAFAKRQNDGVTDTVVLRVRYAKKHLRATEQLSELGLKRQEKKRNREGDFDSTPRKAQTLSE